MLFVVEIVLGDLGIFAGNSYPLLVFKKYPFLLGAAYAHPAFSKAKIQDFISPSVFRGIEVDENNMLIGMKLRQQDGKRKAIDGFRSMNFRTFAAGDSYNDLTMIHKADKGCLFRAPERILQEEPDLKLCTTYDEFFEQIRLFVEED